MKEKLTSQDIRHMLLNLTEDIIGKQEELTRLDSAIGDGDLGMTMTIGMRAIQHKLSTFEQGDCGDVLLAASDAFSEKAASTFGTLFAVMLAKASRSARRSGGDIGTKEAAQLLRAAVDGVAQLGKAQLGDKTLLDALIPATQVMEQAALDDLSLNAAAKAVAAAVAGSDATVHMRAKIGRSGYLGDRTIGQRDPGAATIVFILESFQRYISN